MPNIFKSSEVNANRPNEWIVDLSPANVVNPDAYFYFDTKKSAKRFADRVQKGESASQVYREMSQPK